MLTRSDHDDAIDRARNACAPAGSELAKELDMAIVGIVAIVLAGAVVVAGLVLVGRSVPDIRRYRRIRSM